MTQDNLSDYHKETLERIKLEFAKNWLFKELHADQTTGVYTLDFVSPDGSMALYVHVKSDGSYDYKYAFLK
jgi:hypothetical protein